VSEDLRFEVDAMLVKLAHYLRVLGYDAEYDLRASLATRIARTDASGRVLLTRNRRIGQQGQGPARMLVVAAEDPVEQLREVIATFAIDPEERLFSRCIRCNVALARVDTETVAASVPEGVFASYRAFTACPSCGTVFWKGSHVRNTCRKLGLPDVSERG
jgi:uncharacterized protein